jgi:cysteinyl-tRNA synthetase
LRDRLRNLAEKAGGLQAALDALAPVNGEGRLPDSISSGKAGVYLAAFDKALEDDLSTPRALAEIWGLLRDPDLAPLDTLAAAFDMDRVLGLGLAEEISQAAKQTASGADPNLNAEIEGLIQGRARAKKAKDFAKADEIRNSLKERGIILEDGPKGTTWRSV